VNQAREAAVEKEKNDRIFIEVILHHFTKVIGEVLQIGSSYEIHHKFTESTE